MVGQGVCCSVCDSSNKAALVCPACINNTLLYERRKMLVELGEKRAALQQRLSTLLTLRQPQVDLEVRRLQVATAAAASRERVQQAERALEAAKREAARLRAANAARRAAAERAAGELAARRAEHQAHHPTLLRYQALTHSHVAAMLLAEQRSKLAALLETLPLRVAAIRHNMPGGGGGGSSSSSNSLGALGAGGGGGAGGAAGAAGSGGSVSGGGASPIQVTLCNLKVPDAASVCGLMTQQPDSTSSCLGYLLLLTDLLATYLGGPLLHEGAFQGSTSVLWQQHSFWNRRPSSSNARLPLFMEEGGPGGGLGGGGGGGMSGGGMGGGGVSGGGAAGPGLSARPRVPGLPPQLSAPPPHTGGGALAGALSAISRVMSGGAASGAAAAASAGGYGYNARSHEDEALARQRHTDLRLAYDMLLRSLGCFVRDKVLPLGLQLPPGWGPLGWLAVLCATVRREPGTDAVLTAASAALAAAAAAGGGGGDVRGAGGGAGGGGGAGAYGAGYGWPDADALLGRRGDDGEDGGGGPDSEGGELEEDGWDVVQAPFLPPPPSQPEEVEHWTRAMFTDASRAGGGGGAGGPGGGGVGALAGGLGGPGGGGGLGAAGGASALAAALGGSLGSLRRLQGGGGGGAAGPGLGMGPPSMSLERVRSIFGK